LTGGNEGLSSNLRSVRLGVGFDQAFSAQKDAKLGGVPGWFRCNAQFATSFLAKSRNGGPLTQGIVWFVRRAAVLSFAFKPSHLARRIGSA
jgi:hypothetical protein